MNAHASGCLHEPCVAGRDPEATPVARFVLCDVVIADRRVISMSTHMSRREFLARTGSGAAIALGAGIGGALKTDGAVAAVRSYDAATLALALDGQFAGYPRDAEGGVTEVSAQTLSPRASTLPLAVRFAGGMTRPFLEWIPSILTQGTPAARSLSLFTFSPATMAELYLQSLGGARIFSLETPLCDAASQENVYFRIVVSADSAQQSDRSLGTVAVPPAMTYKPLIAANFRLDIGGSGPKIAFKPRRVLPLVIRRTSLAYGVSPLQISIQRAEAAPFYYWMYQQRQSSTYIERPGVLGFLAADRKSVLASVDLPNLSIARVGIPGEDGSGPDSVEVMLNCRYATLSLFGLAA
jgi:hypothetical protein